MLFAVTLVRDVAGATHRDAQEAVELDRLMRERTSSPSEAFSFKSSPRKVPTLSTQPSASSTQRSNSSLLACCFPSWYLRAVACTCRVACLVICGLQGKLATLRELSGYDIWWGTDRTPPKVVFVAFSFGETDSLTYSNATTAIKCSFEQCHYEGTSLRLAVFSRCFLQLVLCTLWYNRSWLFSSVSESFLW